MGFVFLSFTLIAPVQFKLLRKNLSKGWNELSYSKLLGESLKSISSISNTCLRSIGINILLGIVAVRVSLSI